MKRFLFIIGIVAASSLVAQTWQWVHLDEDYFNPTGFPFPAG